MTTLELAIEYWEQDEPLPLDLAVALMEEGFEVDTLEDKYRP